MKKFCDVKQKKAKYTRQLDKALSMVMPTVIEAFINVYGKRHEKFIRRKLANLKYCYFIPQSHLELFREYHNYLREEDNKLVDYYLEYIDHLGYKYGKIRGGDDEKLTFIYRNFLTKSDLSIAKLKAYNMVEPIEEDCPLYTPRLDSTKEVSQVVTIIILPIIIGTLEMIIHEINHALTCEAVGYIDDVVFEATLFCVNDQRPDTDNTAEEIVNDYIANLVLKEFLRIGGYIPTVLKKYDIGNDYVDNAYIADYLFQKLGSLILESEITHNDRLFINSVGKDNHLHLCELMSELFNNGKDESKYVELVNLIDEMAEKVRNAPEENVEAFFQELEGLGYRVRKLRQF